MLDRIMRHLLWRGRVRAARAWRDAEREQAAEHGAAVRRILDQVSNPGQLPAAGGVEGINTLPDRERSIMRTLLAEVLTADEIDDLEIHPGVWLLPGPPP